MADLFKSLKHEASPSRSGFDLSRKHVFSTKVGQLVPCLNVETVPGDHFEIDLASLTRTNTFNTAAFLRGKQRFDFFFVPYSQLWHPFNQFITQRSDKHSSLQKGSIYCPVMNLFDILTWVHNQLLSEDPYRDIFDVPVYEDVIRLLDMCGYGNFEWIKLVTPDNFTTVIQPFGDRYVNIFRIAAYQHIWYDFYRNKYWDADGTGGVPKYGSSFADYVSAFNFDDIDCSTFANSVISVPESGEDHGRFLNLFSLRFAPWKKDIFTGSLPNQQFGAVSSVDISGVNILNSAVTSDVQTAQVGSTSSLVVGGLRSHNNNADNYSWSIPSAFDVLSLRKAEALQQWKQNTLRGGNMTDDAFESHYGVKPYYDADENVNYLGSFSSALQVNVVESTASSGVAGVNNRVGDLAATGTIVANGNKIKFDAKDFGVIMCVASFVPESEYVSNAIDKANTLHEQFDFFTPEFQNIGLESIHRWQQSLNKINPDPSIDMDAVLGFAPRYSMYKTAVDRVFGQFADTSSPLYAHTGDPETSAVTSVGSLKAWVSPRKDYFFGTSRMVASLYVAPWLYDNVSSVVADDTQLTDFFLHNVFFDIKAIRPMTVLGLPQF